MAELLKGKPVVESIAADLAPRIAALKQTGVTPTLAIVRVGERPDDLSYERTARKRNIHSRRIVELTHSTAQNRCHNRKTNQ